MEKRYYIFRVNGVDNGVTDDSAKAKEVYDFLKSKEFLVEGKTECNLYTTTYNFETRFN